MATYDVTKTTYERQRVEATSSQDAVEQAEAMPQRWQRVGDCCFSTVQINDLARILKILPHCTLKHCIHHASNPGPQSELCQGCENHISGWGGI